MAGRSIGFPPKFRISILFLPQNWGLGGGLDEKFGGEMLICNSAVSACSHS